MWTLNPRVDVEIGSVWEQASIPDLSFHERSWGGSLLGRRIRSPCAAAASSPSPAEVPFTSLEKYSFLSVSVIYRHSLAPPKMRASLRLRATVRLAHGAVARAARIADPSRTFAAGDSVSLSHFGFKESRMATAGPCQPPQRRLVPWTWVPRGEGKSSHNALKTGLTGRPRALRRCHAL